MEPLPRNSPICMKIKAIKGDLDDLDKEISNITQELDNDIPSTPLKSKLKSKTTPINPNSVNIKTNIKQNSYKTPDFKEKYTKKFSSKKVAQTPDFNINSTLHIEDLMSSSDDLIASDSKGLSTPGKTSFSQAKNSYESEKSADSHSSIRNSQKYLANFSSPSSLNADTSRSHSKGEEDTNRLYEQSVRILEKRTHSLFNNDPWFSYNDEDESKSNNKNANNESNAFSQQKKEEDSNYFFPKQSTFTYNLNGKVANKYKSITEMERINETHRKRESLACQHQKEREREIEEECTFKPILSAPVPKISAEEEEKIKIKKQKKIEDSIAQSSKIIHFIDPNSKRIAKKAKSKNQKEINQNDISDQISPSKQTKCLTKKQIRQSCERLSRPRPILTNSDEEPDLINDDDETKKKYCDPEVIERLYQSSMKPKHTNNSLSGNSNYDENENQDNFEAENKKSFHSFMDSASRKIIDRSLNKSRNSNDLFKDSVQVFEDKLKYQKEVQKFNEMHELNLYSFHPQINETPPHFSVNKTDYSTLVKNPSYSTSNTPRAKQIYYESKSNQSSPMRKSFIVSPSPKKKKQKIQVSDDDINRILDEVDAQISLNS